MTRAAPARPAERPPEPRCLLTINGGSSSLKFATYALDPAAPLVAGRIERIGLPSPVFTRARAGGTEEQQPVAAADHMGALQALTAWLDEQDLLPAIAAAAHRVVHGGPRFSEPQRITPSLLDELRAPCEHGPAEAG
ncbi:MAG: hypothetical protein ABJC89_25370, partial [Acidobacteriota bacterium]